jgi:hypothetical protein
MRGCVAPCMVALVSFECTLVPSFQSESCEERVSIPVRAYGWQSTSCYVISLAIPWYSPTLEHVFVHVYVMHVYVRTYQLYVRTLLFGVRGKRVFQSESCDMTLYVRTDGRTYQHYVRTILFGHVTTNGVLHMCTYTYVRTYVSTRYYNVTHVCTFTRTYHGTIAAVVPGTLVVIAYHGTYMCTLVWHTRVPWYIRTYHTCTYTCTYVRTTIRMLCHSFLIEREHTCAPRTTCVLKGDKASS